YGKLVVVNTATLAGALQVDIVNGYGPTQGQQYQVMTFAGHVGTFDTINGQSAGAVQFLNTSVNPTDVTVNVTAGPADLVASNVSTTGNLSIGQNATVHYTVTNSQ